jgi:hypothetical protein
VYAGAKLAERPFAAVVRPEEPVVIDTASRYPQPREGVDGTERAGDDLLDLDDAALARRLMMIQTAQALYSAVLVGNPAPKVAKLYARMSKPQPGDLVMEVTGSHRRGTDSDSAIKGFGILIAARREWMQTDEEWAAELAEGGLEPEDRHYDDAWYVQYGPAAEDVCRWTNAAFVAIPTTPEWPAPRNSR